MASPTIAAIGNVSVGNFADDGRVAIFMMDYPRRARLKLLGRARVATLEAEPDLVSRLDDPAYGAKVERAILIDIEAFDWNCSQHITPRYNEAEITLKVAALQARIADLESNLATTDAP